MAAHELLDVSDDLHADHAREMLPRVLPHAGRLVRRDVELEHLQGARESPRAVSGGPQRVQCMWVVLLGVLGLSVTVSLLRILLTDL